MFLSVMERLVLLSILPEQGNFITLKTTRELRESLSFSDEEQGMYKFQTEGQNVKWENMDEHGMPFTEKEIPIETNPRKIIKEALEKLDKEEKLQQQHYSLYEKFIQGGT